MSKTPSESDIKKILDKAALADARALDAALKTKRKRQEEKEKQDRVKMWEALKTQEAKSSHADNKRRPDTGEEGAKKRKYPDTGE